MPPVFRGISSALNHLRISETFSGSSAGSVWSSRTLSRLTWGFLALGVLLRVARFALNFPLWGDEAFLAVNFLSRGYWGLLQPLDYGQIGPPLFLWVELTSVKLFGFGEFSLRLFPLLCGLGSLFLFRHVAGRVTEGVPLLIAVAIAAVTGALIRHSAEVKPYAGDLLVSTTLLAPALEWLRAPRRVSWLWCLAAWVPLAIGLSHPAVFVAGGVAIGLLFPAWTTGGWRAKLPYALFVAAVFATFALLCATVIPEQSRYSMQGLRAYWAGSFPPLDHPARLARWLLSVHTGRMFAYPIGGAHGLSSLSLAACLVSAVVLARGGQHSILVMLLGPFALGLCAAFLGRYPYGGEMRIMQYVAPIICVMVGIGGSAVLNATPSSRVRRGILAGGLGLLAAGGVSGIIADFMHPYLFPADQRDREFARRFWPHQARDAEVTCLFEDFGLFDFHSLGPRTALYTCNRAIYGLDRGSARAKNPESVTSDHPLRCVLYSETRPDRQALASWLDRMRRILDLRRTTRIDFVAPELPAGRKPPHIVIYEFVPAGSSKIGAAAEARVRR